MFVVIGRSFPGKSFSVEGFGL
uniref:Uncharacterized protein n=1 Tax=Lepeophtheirus salmonis TaxID=72036 RepID=A0A0K2SW58_LEPSM